jgi:putative ABC transport system permease protein
VTTERLVTHRKASLLMELPRSFVDEVHTIPHVTAVTWSNFFAGKDPNLPGDLFTSLAVDPATYFRVYDDVFVAPADLDAWSHDRRGAIVGPDLARKPGWKVGDEIVLESGLFPGMWQLRIDALYTPATKSGGGGRLFLHWAYVDDSRAPEQLGTVLWIASRVDDPARAGDVGALIDRVGDLRGMPTVTQDQRAFTRSFVDVYSAIFTTLNVVSLIILTVMALVLGNTIAMGARERTREYGMLRGIGFRPLQVGLLVLGESLAVGLLGAAIGFTLAYPVVDLGVGRFLEEHMSSFFPHFRLAPGDAIVGLALITTLSAAAGVLPAWAASRVRTIDAVRRA